MSDSADGVNNTGQSRLDRFADGRLAELDYLCPVDRLVVAHTGVPSELEGQGTAALRLPQRSTGRHATALTLVPSCR